MTISGRHDAIRHASVSAKSGDVVVIAGKGHEDYQEVHGKRFPFDDRVVAADFLESRQQSGKRERVIHAKHGN